MKCTYFINIFCHFEFVVCFAPFSHEVERIVHFKPNGESTRRKERIADACTGHDLAVSLITYGVGPVVSMVISWEI